MLHHHIIQQRKRMRGSMANSSLAKSITIFFIVISFFAPQTQSLSQECSTEYNSPCRDKTAAFPLKITAICTILISSILGVTLPLLTKSAPALQPDKNVFVIVKACASGVILATGFLHVLPESFEMLSSTCLDENPWQNYPFTGFVTMLSAVLALMVDSLATSLYSKKLAVDENSVNSQTQLASGVQQTSDGAPPAHFHGYQLVLGIGSHGSQLVRYRVIALVLELGIVVHSVVIGLSLGVSNNVCSIKTFLPVLCFHQMFQGVGLGGSILQAEFTILKEALLVIFFSVITPFGIALGMALTNTYNENSPTSIITVGLLNAISAGLLIYMALVDLLAAEFMGPKLQGSITLQINSYVALLLGAGGMSLIAMWT